MMLRYDFTLSGTLSYDLFYKLGAGRSWVRFPNNVIGIFHS